MGGISMSWIVTFGIFMIIRNAYGTQTYEISAFPGSVIYIPCPKVPSSWTFTPYGTSQPGPLPPDISFDDFGQLFLSPNDGASDEGLYTCLDSSGVAIATTDLTILGLAKFVGCSSQSPCDNDALYTLSDGQSVPAINISFDFFKGGNRNEKQLINFVFIRNPSNVQITSCRPLTMKCFDIEDKGLISFPVKEEYNMEVILGSRTVQDSGVYSVEAELYTTTSAITTITSYFTVIVTTTTATSINVISEGTGTSTVSTKITTTTVAGNSTPTSSTSCCTMNTISSSSQFIITQPPSPTVSITFSSSSITSNNTMYSSLSSFGVPFSVTIADDIIDHGASSPNVILFSVLGLSGIIIIVLTVITILLMVRRCRRAKYNGNSRPIYHTSTLSSFLHSHHENSEEKVITNVPAMYEIPIQSIKNVNTHRHHEETEIYPEDTPIYCEIVRQQSDVLQCGSAESGGVFTIVNNMATGSLPREANSDEFMI